MANFTYPTNVTRFYELMQYNNSVTEGWFGNLILLALFLILFISMYGQQRNVKVAFMGSTFISMIVSILFRIAGLISDFPMILCIVFTGIAFLVLTYGD